MQASSAGILASALGHGAALAGLVWLGGGSPRAAAQGPRLTMVTLLADPQPAQRSAPVEERIKEPRAVAAPARAGARATAPPDRPDGAAPATALPPPPDSAGAVPPAVAPPGTEAAAAAPARGEGDAAAAYAAALWSRIARQRPRGLGVAGTALVLIVVGPGGALEDARIDRSSGDPRLDARALAAVSAAAPFPAPPATMDAAERRFLIPFAYR
jgi:protein TonB